MVDDPEAARRATQAVFGLTPELRISSALQHFQRRYGRLCSRAVWNGPVAGWKNATSSSTPRRRDHVTATSLTIAPGYPVQVGNLRLPGLWPWGESVFNEVGGGSVDMAWREEFSLSRCPVCHKVVELRRVTVLTQSLLHGPVCRCQ